MQLLHVAYVCLGAGISLPSPSSAALTQAPKVYSHLTVCVMETSSLFAYFVALCCIIYWFCLDTRQEGSPVPAPWTGGVALQDGAMEYVRERSFQSTEGVDAGLPSLGAGRLQEGRPWASKASTQASNTTRHFGETQLWNLLLLRMRELERW